MSPCVPKTSILTQIQDDIWKRVKNKVTDKPRYKDIQEIIDKKYYRKEKDIIKAEKRRRGNVSMETPKVPMAFCQDREEL